MRFLLGALLFLLASPVAAQDRYDEMLGQVEKVRGHRFLRKVPWTVHERQEVREQIRGDVSTTAAGDDERGMALFFETLGMAPRGFDLRETVVGVYGESIAGRYSPEKKEFYVVSAGGAPTDQFTLEDVTAVHELTHALQDQIFGLEAMQERIGEGNTDQSLGLKSLIEGEAELVALGSILIQSGMGLDDLPHQRGRMKGSHKLPLEGVPLVLRRYLTFPYEEGADLVEAVRRAGGWELVDQMWKDPPLTSEQVIHPERYLGSRDFPTQITLNLPDVIEDYSLWMEDTGGEFMVRCFLEQHLGAEAAVQPAEGWGGDLLRVYGRGEEALVVWFINWDSPGDALAFTKAARTALAKTPVSMAENLGRGNTVLMAGATPAIQKSVLKLLDQVTLQKKEVTVAVKRGGPQAGKSSVTGKSSAAGKRSEADARAGTKPGPLFFEGVDGFTSLVHGFTIPLPTEWGIDRDQISPMLPLMLVRATGQARAAFHVIKLPKDVNAAAPSPEAVVREMESELGPTLRVFRVTGTRPLKLGSERFLEVMADGHPLKFSVFRGEVLGRTYTVLLAADPGSYSQARTELVASLQKMKFKEP
ncbi:MAG: hypothetical protein HY319_00920 [Armatimonadetes bacterium]|nr:hypothetical protein [Armatimonadota bacterium]